MDWIGLTGKITGFIKKHSYVLLILGVGLVLMLIPSQKGEEASQQTIQEQVSLPTVEQRLAQILCNVAGVGDVQVMLNVATGEETLYQTDDNYSTSSETSTGRQDTVTITDSNRNETGLIRQVNPPVYQGAIIVCEGADTPTVRLAIVEAVAGITGIGTDKISVLKMK